MQFVSNLLFIKRRIHVFNLAIRVGRAHRILIPISQPRRKQIPQSLKWQTASCPAWSASECAQLTDGELSRVEMPPNVLWIFRVVKYSTAMRSGIRPRQLHGLVPRFFVGSRGLTAGEPFIPCDPRASHTQQRPSGEQRGLSGVAHAFPPVDARDSCPPMDGGGLWQRGPPVEAEENTVQYVSGYKGAPTHPLKGGRRVVAPLLLSPPDLQVDGSCRRTTPTAQPDGCLLRPPPATGVASPARRHVGPPAAGHNRGAQCGGAPPRGAGPPQTRPAAQCGIPPPPHHVCRGKFLSL